MGLFLCLESQNGTFIFLYWYMFIWTMAFLVESATGGVFGGDFAASCFYILKSMDFIWVLVWYFGIGDFSVMKSVSGLFVDFVLSWEDSTI